MTRAVILDVDGVLLNWFDGFTYWMEAQGHEVIHGVQYPGSYDMTPNFPGKTAGEIVEWIGQFNLSPAFAELPEWPGASKSIGRLRKAFPNLPFVALTAAGSHPMTVMRRAEAVTRFELDGIHITPLNMSKRAFLEHYTPGSIFVEDNLKHAITGYHAGHQAILMDRPYNRVDNPCSEIGIHRVHEWPGVVSKIMELGNCEGVKERVGG